MTTKQAVSIADKMWADTMVDGSPFDALMKSIPQLEQLRLSGQVKAFNEAINQFRTEIVANWANIIMEVEEASKNENR